MNNFIVRTLSGAVYVTTIVGSLLLDKSLFALVSLAFSILGTLELYRFNPEFKESHFLSLTGGIIAFILFHLFFLGIIGQKWLHLIFLLPFCQLVAELYKKQNNVFGNLSYVLLGYVYISTPLIILNYLNISSIGNYSKVVLSVLVLVWINDTFAYLSGMLFGKHKLFERITPKKTWEGFAGGVIATVLASWLLFKFSGQTSLTTWLIAGFIVAISSVFGDFVESMFKRAAGLKDSGNLIPGHGGILDRIDSLLFVFPVVFVYFSVLS